MRRSNSTFTRAASMRPALGLAGLALAATVLAASSSWAASSGGELPDKKPEAGEAEKPEGGKFEPFKPETKNSTGTVTIGGQSIAYQAIAGTLIVHPKGWDDVARDPKSEKENSPAAAEGESKNPTAEASMFYVAYFKSGGGTRPVTFLYNGGPGSATLWLHMGAFGPRRIVTSTDAHTPAAPYVLVAQRGEPARCDRLGFHRRAGYGLQPYRRKRQGEGILRSRSRRLRVRRIHLAVPLQVRPLEFAEVSVRRELWNAALGGAGEPVRKQSAQSISTA